MVMMMEARTVLQAVKDATDSQAKTARATRSGARGQGRPVVFLFVCDVEGVGGVVHAMGIDEAGEASSE